MRPANPRVNSPGSQDPVNLDRAAGTQGRPVPRLAATGAHCLRQHRQHCLRAGPIEARGAAWLTKQVMFVGLGVLIWHHLRGRDRGARPPAYSAGWYARSTCATPKCCSSSMTRSPRGRGLTVAGSSARAPSGLLALRRPQLRAEVHVLTPCRSHRRRFRKQIRVCKNQSLSAARKRVRGRLSEEKRRAHSEVKTGRLIW
jgi:hypothetical protein